jgi:hypothetical protein|tara:strand:- start:383 stop:526 length:144 start_codon:yes stop_codon:yes gene_type:complete
MEDMQTVHSVKGLNQTASSREIKFFEKKKFLKKKSYFFMKNASQEYH